MFISRFKPVLGSYLNGIENIIVLLPPGGMLPVGSAPLKTVLLSAPILFVRWVRSRPSTLAWVEDSEIV